MNRATFNSAKPLDMNVNRNTLDETPLIVASRDGDLQTVCKLMENESLDVNLSDSSGRTSLYFACKRNHFHVVEKLINHPNIDVNRRPKYGMYAPLYYAALNDQHIETVGEHLKHPNIDVNVLESYRETPIYCTTSFGNYRVVRELLNHDRAMSTKSGYAAAHHSTSRVAEVV